jgi:hypothetical protein
MTPHEATRELYKLIYLHKSLCTYDDIKRCIDSGALLTHVESSYGIPLLFAMRSGCSEDIIKLLIHTGGVDFTYRVPRFHNIWHDFTQIPSSYMNLDQDYYETLEPNILDVDFIYYDSIYTHLLQLYHYSTNSTEFETQALRALISRGHLSDTTYIQVPPYKYDEERIIVPDNDAPVCLSYYTRFKTLCTLCDVDPNVIKQYTYDFPPDMMAFDTIPDDIHDYNWSYEHDIYYNDIHIDTISDE